MKKVIALSLLFFLIVTAFSTSTGSDFIFKKGKEYKTQSERFSDVIGKINGNIFRIGFKSGAAYLIKFSGLNLLNEIKLDLKYKSKKMKYETAFITSGKIVILSSFYNGKDHKEYFFYRFFDGDKMEYSSDLKIMGKVSAKNRRNLGDAFVTFSNDSSKIAVSLYNSGRKKNKERQKVIFSVFNKDLSLLWTGDKALKYRDKMFIINGSAVDNKGNFYIRGQLWIGKGNRRLSSYERHVLIFNKDDDEPEDISVKLNKFTIKYMTLNIAANGDIVIAGFYTPDLTKGIDGSFYLRLDRKTHEVVSSNYKAFPLNFITQGLEQRTKEKMKKKEEKGKNQMLYNYILKDIIMRDDGGIILVAEQFYIEERTVYTANGGYSTYYTYYYGDIIVVNINNNGIIQWNKKIHKYQYTSGSTSRLSYDLGVYDNVIYIIYNDNPANRNLGTLSKLKAYGARKNSDLILCSIDKEGNIKKHFIFNSKEENFLPFGHSAFFDYESGTFYLENYLSKKHKLQLGSLRVAN